MRLHLEETAYENKFLTAYISYSKIFIVNLQIPIYIVIDIYAARKEEDDSDECEVGKRGRKKGKEGRGFGRLLSFFFPPVLLVPHNRLF